MTAVLIVVVVGVAVALVFANGKQASQNSPRFAKHDRLFSPAERSFLGVLEQAIDSRYRIFGKVRLGDIVKPQKGLSKNLAASARNKVNQKHVDFVICLASDLSVAAAVELDDKSHARENRTARDHFVDQALSGAGIPIIHFPAQKDYSLTAVRATLAEHLKASTSKTIAAQDPIVTPIAAELSESPAREIEEVACKTGQMSEASKPPHVPEKLAEKAEQPQCPKCASEMVKRQAKKGPHEGRWFWACTSFPQCRAILPVEE